MTARRLRAMQVCAVALAITCCALTVWAAIQGRTTSALTYAIVAQIGIAIGFDTARKRERIGNHKEAGHR